MKERKRKRGAPFGNRNALKQGCYSTAVDDYVKRSLKKLFGIYEIDQHIKLVSEKLRKVQQDYPPDSLPAAQATTALAHLLRLRLKLEKTYERSLYIRSLAAVISRLEYPVVLQPSGGKH